MEYTDVKIKKAKALKPYIVWVKFNDGTTKEINLEPVLSGSLFGPLRNPELFKRVRVNREIETIEWPNGADFHPETLYRWDAYKEELSERAAKWKTAENQPS